MAVEKPWGPNDPNSAHQLWSRWIFTIRASGNRLPTTADVRENLRTYVRARFRTTVGHVRLDRPLLLQYVIALEIEGPPAHDPEYRAYQQRVFAATFVAQGFGPDARLESMEVGILAGDHQDGRQPTQLIVLPSLPTLHARRSPG